MDISSGIVAFGLTCPGSLMKQLQDEDIENVRNIKSFQTSFTQRLMTWQCHASCKDLDVVTNFIKSISALEELSILNYEPQISILWPAIFHHGKSLKSLAIHTPPMMTPKIWTVSVIKEVTKQLPQLKRLEMDISLEQGEQFIKNTAQSQLHTLKTETSSVQERLSTIAKLLSSELFHSAKPSVLDDVANMNELSSLLVNINLSDSASIFADQHTWNVMGCTAFPPVNPEPCKELAAAIFDTFHAKSVKTALDHLELRFARRCWDDRGQFWTLAHSVHVRKDGNAEGGRSVENGKWGEYLPKWPRDGVLRVLSDQGYRESCGY